MSNQQQATPTSNISTRKKRRGMIEKRRRDKINTSLCELRRLVPAAFEKQGSAKLEKAEILQMTVDYLRMLHARGLADTLTSTKQLPFSGSDESSQQSIPTNGHNPYSHMNMQHNHPSAISQRHIHHQQQQHQQQQQQQSMPTSDTNQLINSNNNNNGDQETQQQQILDTHHHQQQQLSSISTPATISGNDSAETSATLATTMTSPTLNSTSIYSSHSHHHPHHIYNQHSMSAAAVAYHHLSNPLVTTGDMSDMINQHSTAVTSTVASNGASNLLHDPHNPSQAQENVKNQLKVESHPHHHHHYQSSIVIPHSHPSLLNLDHHHHHHHHGQAHAHHPSYLFKSSWM